MENKIIEMTAAQKEMLIYYKDTTWFSIFIGKLNDPDNKVFMSLPPLDCFENWGWEKERECDLMRAWLYPEFIKVV